MAMINKETIIWRGYTSILFWRRPIFMTFIFSLLSILIFFSQHFPLPEEALMHGLSRYENRQYIAFSFLMLAVIAGLYVFTSRISYGRYCVTSSRVIERHGIISNKSNEVRIQDIRGINMRQSFSERLLGIGTLEISSAATERQEVAFINIRNPSKVKEIILGIQAYGYEAIVNNNGK